MVILQNVEVVVDVSIIFVDFEEEEECDLIGVFLLGLGGNN